MALETPAQGDTVALLRVTHESQRAVYADWVQRARQAMRFDAIYLSMSRPSKKSCPPCSRMVKEHGNVVSPIFNWHQPFFLRDSKRSQKMFRQQYSGTDTQACSASVLHTWTQQMASISPATRARVLQSWQCPRPSLDPNSACLPIA